jgi:hypothetical protein
LSLPQDSDGATFANLYQAFKALGDYITYSQKTVLLAQPRLPVSASSGFTAVTYVSFGGTVTPSGNVKIASGLNFMVLCTLGGAVGVAQFKTSMDGGNTYGAVQTTAASMTDATSGITFAFSGTLTLNGTAQFFSALAPVAVWTGTDGAFRSQVDHNGMRAGRIFEGWEGYLGNSANITTDATFLQGSVFRTGMAGSGSQLEFNTYNEGTDLRWNGHAARLNPATTNGNRVSVELGALTMVTPRNTDNTIMVLEVSISLNTVGTSNQTVIWGLTTDLSAAPRNSAAGGIWFKRLSGGNWLAIRRTASADTTVDTGIAPVANTANRLRIEIHGGQTPLGSAYGSVNGLILYFIDDKGPWSNTNPPLSTYALLAEVANTAGLGGNQQVDVSPMHWYQTLHGNAIL